MEEVTLRAIERAMPGHGRARIHNSLLTKLGIADNEEIEVVAPAGATLTLTVFADSLVEPDQIRISSDDLKKLGIANGDGIIVRRKVPLSEQIKSAAGDLSDKVHKGVSDLGETVSEKTAGLKEGTAQVAQDLHEKAKGVSAKIQDMVPTSRFNATVEAGLKRLKPEDAAALKKMLLEGEGEVRAVNVTAPTAAGRTIQNLTLPPDLVIAAIQREDNSLVAVSPDAVLQAGDVVYLIGEEKGLDYMTTLLEG